MIAFRGRIEIILLAKRVGARRSWHVHTSKASDENCECVGVLRAALHSPSLCCVLRRCTVHRAQSVWRVWSRETMRRESNFAARLGVRVWSGIAGDDARHRSSLFILLALDWHRPTELGLGFSVALYLFAS